MSIFYLPDLGEGLPDAEVREWYVQVGDEVKVDQPLAAMETAKAVVDVPSPQAGKISKLHGNPGDIIKTGAPLVEFEGVAVRNDTGTVVGHIEQTGQVVKETAKIGSAQASAQTGIKATPAVRALAQKLNIDLTQVKATGPNGTITLEDIQKATTPAALKEGFEALHGTRRMMAINMQTSHQSIVPVTLMDDADIHSWPDSIDITVKIMRALIAACQTEPALNAWFDGEHNARRLFKEVHLGMAVDSPEGLFVPVIHHAEQLSDEQLRATINEYKQGIASRNLPQEKLKGATIVLSNFGNFAGRYANPIVVPPTVAILGCGKIRHEVVAVQQEMQIHKILPLSLTFDHRAATGGEAARFLDSVIKALETV